VKKILATQGAPGAIGPYSQATLCTSAKLLFTAGQIPLDPSGNLVDGGIEAQTRQVMANLKAVLECGGSALEHILKVTIFLKDMNDFPELNRVYGEYFPVDPPARSTVEVSRLPRDVRVEIEAVAVVPTSAGSRV
jgi:2-iminobutanoate/2-iminopropanoate deaminase